MGILLKILLNKHINLIIEEKIGKLKNRMLGPNTHSKVEINKLNDKQFKTKSKRSLITSKTNNINK